MTIKLLLAMPIMTIVLLLGVGQAMDASALLQVTISPPVVVCDDNDTDCDEADGILGLLAISNDAGDNPNDVCDIGISSETVATKEFNGDAVNLKVDMDLKCFSLQGTTGEFKYKHSETGFFGKTIVCSNTKGGGATLTAPTDAEGVLNIKFWVNPSNTLNAKEILLFDVTSTKEGNIPWTIPVDVIAEVGGAYSYTMEAVLQHQDDSINQITTFDVATECVPVVGGELLPISTQSLMLGGLGMSLTWLVPVVASIGGIAAYIKYGRN